MKRSQIKGRKHIQKKFLEDDITSTQGTPLLYKLQLQFFDLIFWNNDSK